MPFPPISLLQSTALTNRISCSTNQTSMPCCRTIRSVVELVVLHSCHSCSTSCTSQLAQLYWLYQQTSCTSRLVILVDQLYQQTSYMTSIAFLELYFCLRAFSCPVSSQNYLSMRSRIDEFTFTTLALSILILADVYFFNNFSRRILE